MLVMLLVNHRASATTSRSSTAESGDSLEHNLSPPRFSSAGSGGGLRRNLSASRFSSAGSGGSLGPQIERLVKLLVKLRSCAVSLPKLWIQCQSIGFDTKTMVATQKRWFRCQNDVNLNGSRSSRAGSGPDSEGCWIGARFWLDLGHMPDQILLDQPTGPAQTGPDQTGPDQTRPDQTRPDQTLPAHPAHKSSQSAALSQTAPG
eukprot:gene10630-biopygen22830